MKLTKKQISAWAKEFKHISKGHIELESESGKYKSERGLYAHLQRYNATMEQEHSKSLPIYIEIDVTWNNNRTWGYCPTASMRWEDAEGHWHYIERAGHASGCGYDKHSTAVAECLNRFANWRYAIRRKRANNVPYGLNHIGDPKWFPYFEGGVGMSCYPRIMDWLGFKMKHVAWTDTYDKWVIVKKSEAKRFA